MNGIGGRWGMVTRRWWLIGLIVLVLTPIGMVTAQQTLLRQESPATGHAQVVTQGIDDLPDGQVVWRVVERTASPRTEAKSGRRVLGFVLATEEPVLLTNVTDDGLKDVARLAPGESFLVTAGTKQIRASFTDEAVKYLSFELVPADDAENTNGGKLLFKSAEFSAPDGERDIDLVRNLLADGEQATVPDTGESVAILATEGAVDILPSGGKGRTLEAGEGAIFAPGELEIEAVSTSGQAGGVRAQIASLTSSLQDDDEAVAAYVVAVIGPEIPPPPIEQAATSTPQPTAVPPTEVSLELPGSITVFVNDCPEGMTVETLEPDLCGPSAGDFDFALSGPNGDYGLGDAVKVEGGWLWPDLPMGQYALNETSLPDAYTTYFIPGSAAVGGSADEGYTVTIDESAPDIGLNVYHLQIAPQTGSTAVDLLLCPSGSVPSDFDPNSCKQATDGFAISLTSVDDGTVYDMESNGGSSNWTDLPLGSYSVVVDVLPRGWSQYLAPDGNVYPAGAGAIVQIGGDFEVSTYVALYAFSDAPD
jgi:hypothetical protein